MFRYLVLLTCLAFGQFVGPGLTHAQGPQPCLMYDYQVDAQADFERLPESSLRLEFAQDGDGTACNHLPSKPSVLDGTQRMRGDFADDDAPNPTVEGTGYSNRYEVRLTLLQFAPSGGHSSRCPELASSETLHELFSVDRFARPYYAKPTDGTIMPPDEGSQRLSFTGIVWTVVDDPQAPVLLNVWLLEHGLAYFTVLPLQDDWLTDQMIAAEQSAKAAQRGVWGDCVITEIPSPVTPYTTPEPPADSIVFESSSGDQVVPFTISTGTTYQLTVDLSGGQFVFAAADVYYSDGTWIPQMSITSAESGQYSSAGYLDPGSYYIQVKAVGTWRITLTTLEDWTS
jgi:hypothetical protein